MFYPYPSGLLHWHWGNHMIAPVSVKQPWRIWVNKSLESITTIKRCAYSMGYTQTLGISTWVMSLSPKLIITIIFNSLLWMKSNTLDITRLLFWKHSQMTPHSSPSWLSYGVSFVSSNYSALLISQGQFSEMTHNWYPIAHLWSWAMGCLLWAHILTLVQPYWPVQYHLTDPWYTKSRL